MAYLVLPTQTVMECDDFVVEVIADSSAGLSRVQAQRAQGGVKKPLEIVSMIAERFGLLDIIHRGKTTD
jgi:hypothetical protein